MDVAISNGVVNLSPRKGRALAEAFRVLRPGGRGYPLFPPGLIATMRRLLSPERHAAVARSVVFTARKP